MVRESSESELEELGRYKAGSGIAVAMATPKYTSGHANGMRSWPENEY